MSGSCKVRDVCSSPASHSLSPKWQGRYTKPGGYPHGPTLRTGSQPKTWQTWQCYWPLAFCWLKFSYAFELVLSAKYLAWCLQDVFFLYFRVLCAIGNDLPFQFPLYCSQHKVLGKL